MMKDSSGPSKQKRRRLRFSLRTLLVIVSLCCLVLGMEAWRANKQAHALRQVRALGGSVLYNTDSPIELCHVVGEDFMSHAVAIDLAFSELSDADLEELTADLKALRHLSWVRVSGTKVTRGAAIRLKDALPGVSIYNSDPADSTNELRPRWIQEDRAVIPMHWGEDPIE